LDQHGRKKLSSFITFTVCTLILTLPTTSIALPTPPTQSDFTTDQYIVFDDVGTMVSSLGFLHVIIPINISTLHDQAMLLAYNLHNLTTTANETTPTDTLKRVLLDIINVQIIKLNEVISDLITLDSLLPENSKDQPIPKRSKRFIFLPPLIAVSVEFDHMKKRYYRLADEYSTLKQDYLQLQYKYDLLMAEKDAYKQKYQNLTAFVKALQQKYPQDIDYPDTSAFVPVTSMISDYVTAQFKTKNLYVNPEYEAKRNAQKYFENNFDLKKSLETISEINNLANMASPLTNSNTTNPPTHEDPTASSLIEDDPELEIGRAKRDLSVLAELTESQIDLSLAADLATVTLQALNKYDELRASGNASTQTCNHGREKRAAGVIAMGAIGALGGLLGTFLGLYNMAEIKQLQSQVGNLNEQSKLLTEISLKQEKAIKDLLMSIDNVNSALQGLIVHNPSVLQARLEHHITMFQDKVRQALAVVQQLQNRRLSVEYLDKQELNAMHEALQKQAHNLGYELLPEKITDYFQLEASYLRVEQDIVLILHVPCVAPHGKLRIYKHIPYPFPIADAPKIRNDSIAGALLIKENYNNTLAFTTPLAKEALFVKSEHNFIAIGTDNKYKVFTEDELTECDRHGRYFLCEGHQILRTKLAESCLGALYLRLDEGIHKHCKFERRPLEEEVYQLSSTNFLVFSPERFTTKLVCTNASLTNTPVFIQGATEVHVPPGCTAALNSHVISADLNIRISPPPIHAIWKWNPLSFPSDMLEDVRAVDNRLASVQDELVKIRSEASITSEVTQLQHLQLIQGKMLPWTGPIAYAAAALVIIGVVLFAYGCYRQRQQGRTETTNLTVAYHQNPESVYMPLPAYDQVQPVNTTAHYHPSAPGHTLTKKNSSMCQHNKLFGACCPKPV